MSALASVKLSPAVKALIAAPHARGSVTPALVGPAAVDLFRRIRSKGEQGGVDPSVWLTLGTAAVMTVNSPGTLCELWNFASEGRQMEGRAQVAAVMRETGLKCISFNGIPRTINNLAALRSHLPEDVTALLDKKAHRLLSPVNTEATIQRGKELWDAIYEPHSAKLLAKLEQSHPDLPVHILQSHYAALLSDPFSTSPPGGHKVGRVLTSLVAITCLRAQQGVGPQVTSHVFGLKKALLPGGGAEREDFLEGQDWLASDQGVQWILDSVDDISEAVGRGEITFARPMNRQAKL